MALITCTRCGTVGDASAAPVQVTTIEGAAYRGMPLPNARQEDRLCRHCGGLLERRLDGTVVAADTPDPRVSPPAG